jgi:uncharacterized protein YgiM (DUF1202 family)
VYAFDTVNLRDGPGTSFNILAGLSMTDPLTVLGDSNAARSRLGAQGEWLQVQTESGLRGFVAAWLVHSTGQAAPESGITVYPLDYVNVRARAAVDANILTVARLGDALTVLGEKSAEQGKIGQPGEWLNVRTAGLMIGYVAAWLVQAGKTIPSSPGGGAVPVIAYPTTDINLRAQASLNSPRVGGAFRNDPLTLLDTDMADATGKLGKPSEWVFVQARDGTRGWAAAWLVSATLS